MTSHHEGRPEAGAAGSEQGRAPASATGEPNGGYQGPTADQAPHQGFGPPQGMAGAGMYYHPQVGAAPPPGPAYTAYAPEVGQVSGFAGPGMGYGPSPGMGGHGHGHAYAPGPGPYYQGGQGGVAGYPGQPVYGGYPPYPPPGAPVPWAVAQPGMGHGISELMDDALKGDVNPSKLGRYLNDGDFIKGALVGAAVVLLLTDNPLRQALFRGTAKAAEKVKEGFGQVKEAGSGKSAASKAAGEEPESNAD
nr:hypothetical protein [Gammaproteobacteria bacterium]